MTEEKMSEYVRFDPDMIVHHNEHHKTLSVPPVSPDLIMHHNEYPKSYDAKWTKHECIDVEVDMTE